jgi:hypothetical protein
MKLEPWRCVLLDLALMAGVCAAGMVALHTGLPEWRDLLLVCLYSPTLLVPQAVLLLIVGPSAYVRPMPLERRMAAAAIVGSGITLLVFALWDGLCELADGSQTYPGMTAVPVWIGSVAFVFLFWVRGERLWALRRTAVCLLVASGLELCVAVPANAVVTARPPPAPFVLHLEGLSTGFAVVAGVAVLGWSSGLSVVLAHFRRARQSLKGVCLACGYNLRGLSEMRCAECGRAFTFEEVHATAEELQFAGAKAMPRQGQVPGERHVKG